MKVTKIYVLAKNYQQFSYADRALRKLAPLGAVVQRITAPENLRGLRSIRIVGLPGWSQSFSKHEKDLMESMARMNRLSLYNLSPNKYKALLDEARTVEAVRRELVKEFDSQQGGDSPDS